MPPSPFGFTASAPELAWLLEGFVERVTGARGAVLLSGDGIHKTFHGLDQDDVDRLAAAASGLYAIVAGTAQQLGDVDAGGRPQVRQVICEMGALVLYVCTVGAGSRLAVLADREADAAVIGHEMVRLGNSVRTHLDTPSRQTA
ncbi:roadblock/LC7 domain-containing protein [Streptomyces megasporus]|uniref:roadblock/LC7 domain-containing protein n=1 Tax=Streptomyces megasporus TaxID=44060 RepID=UPI0004E1A76A|nr:roadblock/LC7 domain-containing protein [Streptomyces megasporus]